MWATPRMRGRFTSMARSELSRTTVNNRATANRFEVIIEITLPESTENNLRIIHTNLTQDQSKSSLDLTTGDPATRFIGKTNRVASSFVFSSNKTLDGTGHAWYKVDFPASGK